MERDQWLKRAAAVVAVSIGLFAVAVFTAAMTGAWAWVLVWGIVFAALVVAAVVYARRPHHPTVGAAPHPDAVAHRIVVVTDGGCRPAGLRKALAAEGDLEELEVLVVAPALGSRTARWTNDESAYAAAQSHLDDTLAGLRELGVQVHGHVGSHDPMQAADDALREFPAAALVFATCRDENWLEHGVFEEARVRYGIRVTQVLTEEVAS
jgi:hypothetical protein